MAEEDAHLKLTRSVIPVLVTGIDLSTGSEAARFRRALVGIGKMHVEGAELLNS